MLEMMNLSTVKLPEEGGKVKKIAPGRSGIIVLMESGNVYGRGSQYFSGTGSTIATWNYLSDGIADVWTSEVAVLMRTVGNRWLFMGLNQYFNTGGFGSTVTTLTDVTTDMTIPAGLTIKQVVLGYRSIAVVFTNGQYAMCGTNNNGGLGIGNNSTVRTLTLRTDFTNVEKIDLDWATYDTTYLLTKAGSVYVSGESNYGQNGTTTGSTTWRLQSSVSGTIVDIVATTYGFFRIVYSGGAYQVYAQGRDINKSLGTNSTANVAILNPTLVFSDIQSSRPVIYIGRYSARLKHPNGRIYFTGSGTGNLQGTGTDFQPTYAVFTALPPEVPYAGEYSSIRGEYSINYYLEDGVLYGVGQAASATQLLPGYGTDRLLSFMPLDTSELV